MTEIYEDSENTDRAVVFRGSVTSEILASIPFEGNHFKAI